MKGKAKSEKQSGGETPRSEEVAKAKVQIGICDFAR